MLGPSDLHNYQNLAIAHLMENPRCALWAGMGMGKTATVLTALDRINLIEDVFPALVIAPLRVAQSTWPEEPAKWSHLQHLRVAAVTGDLAERNAALRSNAQIFATNYEQLPWLVELFGKKWPFKTIVADESTKLKGFRLRQGTKRSRALASVAHAHCNRFIELTGTPSPNGLQDLWGQGWFIDQGERLGRTFSTFEQRWFQRSFDGFSIKPLANAQGEIEDKLRDVCLSLRAEDYFDLREPVKTVVNIDLPPAARKIYKSMENTMFAEIADKGVEAFNAAGSGNKCQQIASGAVYMDDKKNWEVVHDEKIRALESIIEEAAGMPVLVAYNFRHDLERILKAFPQARVLDKNPQTIKDWNAGKIPMLLAHPASAGHGLNLQYGGNILVYFSIDWNLELHEQIFERIGPVRQLQAGFDRAMFVYYIIARGTVEDEMIMPRLESKASVQDILTRAMRRFHERANT